LALVSLLPLGSLAAQTLDSLPFEKKVKLAKAGDEDAQVAVGHAYDKGPMPTSTRPRRPSGTAKPLIKET